MQLADVNPTDRRWGKGCRSIHGDFGYDPLTNDLLLVRSSSGTVIDRYLNGPGEDQVLADVVGINTSWYLTDHQGSVRTVLNANGTVTRSLDYDEFGNVTSTYKPQRFGYTGQQYDPETGLDYYGARYYDPKMGRFLNQDPAGEGTNLYDYVGNNPMNLTDPTGMNAFGLGGSNYGSAQSYLGFGDFTDSYRFCCTLTVDEAVASLEGVPHTTAP